MVSKTHKQRQKKKEILQQNGGTLPAVVPSIPKSIHLKKTRPKMKGKKKIRLGLESPVDIYEGIEDKKGVAWTCPTCKRRGRVLGFCVVCATGKEIKKHSSGRLLESGTTKKALTVTHKVSKRVAHIMKKRNRKKK
ncbi:hypothetical protein AGDE_00942 [Angomonas deanei]|uniref:Uncharacterized protein n=1 Tax=Angomonas deanei TaxID=59799 RepID=S9WJD3_9TRYP|nr:hypothetical protein AGDE_04532 [Angomonas deanei]EPY42981.1 hypothetical protein AGDE_00942 [Angomonas deanei]CAD2215969.1 hypothetical protein, conserved [Angomonas deanei]|eukprot:EPY39396.1 hypothetical protein AGDE_04532 [Angomonas deanei]